MAILSGSISYLRFSVTGNVPNSLVEFFEKSLAIRRFAPLHPEGRDLESSGWVTIQNPYLDDQRILNHQFLYGDLVILGYREDSIKYPKAMLKDLVACRLQEHPESNRKAVEDAVMAELRHRLLPRSKVVDVLWDLSKQQVRFFAKGKSLAERFQKLFEQTFQMKIEPLDYAYMAHTAQLSLSDKGSLERLEPQEIFA